MIKILSIALIGMLATAATSTPFKHRRQYGQQVIFRSDLRADTTPGVGQSPEFKGVYRKPMETPSIRQTSVTPLTKHHSKPHPRQHHGTIRHHLHRRSGKSKRRQRNRRIPRYPHRHRQHHHPLHEHGHKQKGQRGPTACHTGDETGQRGVVYYGQWGADGLV